MASDTPLPLDEPVELTGEWWLPADPDKQAIGSLSYAPEERMKLHTTRGSGAFPHNESIPWVHGLTIDGRPVTLRNCFVYDWSLNMPGGVSATLYAQQAFVGMYAESDAELKMLSLRARIVNLSEWMSVSGLSVNQTKRRVTSIQYAQPGPRSLGRAGGALLTVGFEPVGQAEPAGTPFKLKLEQQSWFQIGPRRARAFDELDDVLARFRAFLSFATGVDCALIELQGTARVPIREIGPNQIIWQTMPVWVLYERTTTRVAQQDAKRMLFRYADLQKLKLRPLGRWYRNWSRLGPVVNVYLSGLPTRPLHLEYRFLAYAQAVEALHFRMHPSYMVLQARLDDLVSRLPARIKRVVPSGFTVLAKRTRNYFTHWSPNLEAKAAKGEQLVHLTRAVKLLFEITLLMELGFTKTEIADAVLEKNQRLVREVASSFLEL